MAEWMKASTSGSGQSGRISSADLVCTVVGLGDDVNGVQFLDRVFGIIFAAATSLKAFEQDFPGVLGELDSEVVD